MIRDTLEAVAETAENEEELQTTKFVTLEILSMKMITTPNWLPTVKFQPMLLVLNMCNNSKPQTQFFSHKVPVG